MDKSSVTALTMKQVMLLPMTMPVEEAAPPVGAGALPQLLWHFAVAVQKLSEEKQIVVSQGCG